MFPRILLGDAGEAEAACWLARIAGRVRSVEDAEKVWLNHPVRRVGREGEKLLGVFGFVYELLAETWWVDICGGR